MTETDSKKLKEVVWLRQHTLTQDQSKQLILDKLKRAEAMHSKQREMFLHKHR